MENYELLTEAELINLARTDADAMYELLVRYEPLIKNAIRFTADKEDSEDIARLAFIEGVHDFDAKMGVPFAGFIKRRVVGAVWTQTRRDMRRSEVEIHKLTEMGRSDKIDDKLDLEGAMKILSPTERALIEANFILGLTQKRIAEIFHLSPVKVHRIMKEAMSKMKSKLILDMGGLGYC